MTDQTGPQQPATGQACPACGHVAPAPVRYCPQCGRPWAAPQEPEFIQWAKAGWALFVRDIPMAVGLSLVVVVPCAAVVIFCYFGFFGVAVLADPTTDAPVWLAVLLGGLVALLALAMSVVVPALQAGVYACFLEGMRTGRLSFDKIWTGFRNWWACTWVSGTLGSAALLCFPLLFILIGIPIVVGIVGLAWFSLFRIVDKERGGMEALSFAWRVMWERLWLRLVFVLLLMALMNVGVAGMYIGVFVTVPLAIAIFAAAYDTLGKEREAALEQDQIAGSIPPTTGP